MKCKICDAELEDAWSYCPFCGTQKNLKLDKGFEEVLSIFEKNFRNLLGVNFSDALAPGKGFIVEVTQERDGPKVNVRELAEENEDRVEAGAQTAPMNLEVLEPKVEFKENGKLVEVSLPGVKSENVQLKKLANSVEVRAVVGNKIYFTIIPNAKFPSLVSHKFESSVLTLYFS